MSKDLSIDFSRRLDLKDPLFKYRDEFNIPKFQNEDSIYFTGNSLGLQLKKHDIYLKQELEDWRKMGVEGHFHAQTPWFDYHKSLVTYTSNLVGAREKEVVTMNGLSVNLHLLLTSFYHPDNNKYKILCEPNLFPSDLYILQSQIKLKGFDPDDAIVFLPHQTDGEILEEDIYKTIKYYKNELALIFIGGVNYYTGQVFNIDKITAFGHSHNIVVGFDLAHAVGNINLELHKWNVDFAAWCSYKYLNSGPGNVSSVFIHENQIAKKPFRLSGWWGHESDNRFSIHKSFNPIDSAEGWQLSNAPIFGMSIYRVSLELFDKVGMSALVDKRIKLSMYLEHAIQSINNYASNIKLKIITPGKPHQRGAQLSIIISKNGKQIVNKLKQNGVYVDWRDPNVMRLAPTPLYNSYEDIAKFYHIFCQCI